MKLLCADVAERPGGTWWPIDSIGEAGLPTLFAKLAQRGSEWRASSLSLQGRGTGAKRQGEGAPTYDRQALTLPPPPAAGPSLSPAGRGVR
jgi:hypothetical protein